MFRARTKTSPSTVVQDVQQLKMVQMVWQSQIFLRFLSTLPDAFTHLLEKCTKFYFFKIEQLNEVSTLEVVQFVREKRTYNE